MRALIIRAKRWENILFSLRNVVPTTLILLMTFASYLATGSYAISVVLSGIILTASRAFDGLIDPILALIIDRMDGRFGRFRPIMVLGYVIIAAALILLFFVGPQISGPIPFIASYLLYIIGYSCYSNASNAAMPLLTTDPSQRTMNGRWEGIFVLLTSTLYNGVYLAGYLVPKYGKITAPLLREMCITALVIAGAVTFLVCLSISAKDKPRYYAGAKNEDIGFRDLVQTLVYNRPLKLLIASACVNKLALQTASNSAIALIVWGIIAGDYSFRSSLAVTTFIPTALVIFVGMGFAAEKFGKIRAVVYSSWGAIATAFIQFIFFVVAPQQISTNPWVMVGFLAAYALCGGFKQMGTACIYPMLADVADYERYRTGKFVPGIVTAVYTFVDNIITSFAPLIVSVLMAAVGFKDVLPQVTDALSPGIFFVAMFSFLGIPILGWLVSIAAMKFYELTPEKMEEIQTSNQESWSRS